MVPSATSRMRFSGITGTHLICRSGSPSCCCRAVAVRVQRSTEYPAGFLSSPRNENECEASRWPGVMVFLRRHLRAACLRPCHGAGPFPRAALPPGRWCGDFLDARTLPFHQPGARQSAAGPPGMAGKLQAGARASVSVPSKTRTSVVRRCLSFPLQHPTPAGIRDLYSSCPQQAAGADRPRFHLQHFSRLRRRGDRSSERMRHVGDHSNQVPMVRGPKSRIMVIPQTDGDMATDRDGPRRKRHHITVRVDHLPMLSLGGFRHHRLEGRQCRGGSTGSASPVR